MAKKSVDPVVLAERGIRQVLSETLGGISQEEAYVEAALEAIELVAEGLKMRLEELKGEAE